MSHGTKKLRRQAEEAARAALGDRGTFTLTMANGGHWRFDVTLKDGGTFRYSTGTGAPSGRIADFVRQGFARKLKEHDDRVLTRSRQAATIQTSGSSDTKQKR